MKSSLITAALLLCTDATQDETSLMQGLMRSKELAPEKASRKDNTAKLMETATKMMKNGATPDVVTFIETTITEVNANVLGAIVDEHHHDQDLIYEILARFDAAIAEMEACAASVRQQHTDRDVAVHQHQLCRADESLECARSRKCEEELEELWRIVKMEEEEMREIHWDIHGQWCAPVPPPQPGLDDPFEWQPVTSKEGPETSLTDGAYPVVDYTADVIEFRHFSVTAFGRYIEQKPKVELAWENYNRKLLECAAKEETWTLKVDDCDAIQDTMQEQACEHHSSNRQCAATFGHEYALTMVEYNNAVTTITQLEYDRKREWETLHIVTCLLETVYTHVIHSIQTGEPCPTTESHPDQTAAEINTCHIIEESMTANLTIDYGNPPTPPELPPVVEPPCTAQYIWETTGSFSAEIQGSHRETIALEGLESYFTTISAFGWAGCAAPKACTPCETEELVIDEEYTECATCLAHQAHLHPGQMDWDSFKCLAGNECIKASGRCNGISQCGDGSDELGCDNLWGVPAILGEQECNADFSADVQFRCATGGMCAPAAGKCNGVHNCDDGSDEAQCATTTTEITVEAMTGFTATIETPTINSEIFYDRTYVIDSLGSFTGHSMIKMSNEDKHIRHSHVQMKLRLATPTTVYIAKLDTTSLPWLAAEGWELSSLEGVSYHGVRETRHTDWSGELNEDTYGPGEVYEKTFPAGAIELRGNNGGDGSYVVFVAAAGHGPAPPATDNYHYGVHASNECETNDVSEAECLAAVQSLLPQGVTQGRTNLVAGSWGWVPPGCSVQSAFTHGRDGDWAAHYNRNPSGNNDGGYTPVCVSDSPHYSLSAADTKCPHENADRLFRNPDGGSSSITLEQCYAQCATTPGCNAFSYGSFQGAYVCMGCTGLENAQTHVGFTAYTLAHAPTHETQCLGVHEAEAATLNGAIVHANTASAAHQGFTGSSFVDYINASGDYIEWSLPCSGGSATLSFRYSLAAGDRPLRVTVNGVEAAASLSTPATGAWNQWGEASVEVDLSSGSNTIRLAAITSSGANTDSLIIS